MLKRLQTPVLALLVIICIYFTSLYFERVHALEPLLVAPGLLAGEVGGGEEAISPESYIDFFAPHYILAHQEGRHYRAQPGQEQYELLWQALKAAVAEIEQTSAPSLNLRETDAAEWLEAQQEAYEYRFAGPQALHYWWSLAQPHSRLKFYGSIYFHRLLVAGQGEYIYLQNTADGRVWKWPGQAGSAASPFPSLGHLVFQRDQEVRQVVLPAGLSGVSGSLFAAADSFTLPEVLATLPVTEANKADIVKKFFNIVPRVQKTETPGGGHVIENYITARQEVLVLHNSGLLEYSEIPKPPGGSAPAPAGQFGQAYDFVKARGGWPQQVISAGMEARGENYRFDFKQLHGGLPVVDFVPTLAVEMAPGGIQNYQRRLYNLSKPGYFQFEVRAPEDALAQVVPVADGRAVADVYLAYYQRPHFLSEEKAFSSEPMYLYPVWVVEFADGAAYYLHAYMLANDPGIITP